MPLKYRVTSDELAKMPDPIRSEYVADGDNFILSVEPFRTDDGAVFELVNTTPLKSALEADRTKARTLEKTVSDYEKRFKDLDPVAAREALAKVSEMDKWDPDEKLKEHKARFEAQIVQQAQSTQDQLIAKHNEETAELKSKIEARTSQLRANLIDAHAAQALAPLDGEPTLLLPVIRSQTNMIEMEDGSVKVVVIDPATGNTRVSMRDGVSGDMTVEELVQELKRTPGYARAFPSDVKGGAGLDPRSRSGSSTANPWKKGPDFNLTEQGRIQRENPSLAARLKASA